MNNLQKRIEVGALIIGAAAILSRVFGLFRDRLLADRFSASRDLDLYVTAFKLPDFLFNILILGALSSSFLPLFVHARQKTGMGKDSEVWEFVNNVLHVLFIPLGILLFGIFFFAPEIMQVVAPGFAVLERMEIARLTRIMLLSVIFFGLSNLSSGILNAQNRFFAFAFAPLFYNLGIIIGIAVFVPLMGLSGLAWGVVFGSFMHFAVQFPSILKLGYRYRWIFRLRDHNVVTMVRMMGPRTLSLLTTQLNLLVNITLGSYLVEGSISSYYFANNLLYFPVGAFGISLAISSFSAFSEAASGRDPEKFKLHLSHTIRRVLFFMIPTALAFLLLRAQIVRLVYGTEHFSWQATSITSQTLGIFSISMIAVSLSPVLTRAFYAQKNTKIPFIVSAVSLVMNAGLALVLFRDFGVYGLAMAFSAASIVEVILLFIMIRSTLPDIDEQGIVAAILRMASAGLAAALVIHGMKYFFAEIVDMHTLAGIFIQGVGSALFGGMMYLAIAFHYHFEEVTFLRESLKKFQIGFRRFFL